MVNPAVLILMAFLLCTARTRNDQMRALAVLITLLSQQDAILCAHSTTALDYAHAVLFLAALRER